MSSSCLRLVRIAPAEVFSNGADHPECQTRLNVDCCTSNLWTTSYYNAITIYSEHIRCRTVCDLHSVHHADVILSHECLNTFVLQVRLLTLPVLECNYSQMERTAAGTTPPFWDVILSAVSIFRAQKEGCRCICWYSLVDLSSSGDSSMFSGQLLASEAQRLLESDLDACSVTIHYLFSLVPCNEGLYPPSSPFH